MVKGHDAAEFANATPQSTSAASAAAIDDESNEFDGFDDGTNESTAASAAATAAGNPCESHESPRHEWGDDGNGWHAPVHESTGKVSE